MTRIISIINQKGGVGKTTTAQNLAAGLEKKGFKTLLIDLDAQCNLTYSINLDSKYTIYDVFSDEISIKEAICNNFIAGSPLLSTIDTILNQTGKEYKLKGKGLLAQAISHEVDHLEGILFVDKIIPGTMEVIK